MFLLPALLSLGQHQALQRTKSLNQGWFLIFPTLHHQVRGRASRLSRPGLSPLLCVAVCAVAAGRPCIGHTEWLTWHTQSPSSILVIPSVPQCSKERNRPNEPFPFLPLYQGTPPQAHFRCLSGIQERPEIQVTGHQSAPAMDRLLPLPLLSLPPSPSCPL